MPIVKILAKGRVVIPKQIREAPGIVAGAKLHVRIEGKEIVLYPLPADPIHAMCGMVKGGPSLTKALLAERREDLEREEKKLTRFLRLSRQGTKGERAGRAARGHRVSR